MPGTRNIVMALLLAAFVPLAGPRQRLDDACGFIVAVIEGYDHTLGAVSPAERADLRALYQPDGGPLWIDAEGRSTRSMRDALAALSHASDDGLDPTDYFPDLIEQLTVRPDAAASSEDRARLDVAVSAAMLRYLRDLHAGRVDPRTLGFRLDWPGGRDVPGLLRAAIAEERIAGLVESTRPPLEQYRRLRSMLPRYREAGATLRVRQIELALERLRWLPGLGAERLVGLNIPMFRLWAWDANGPDAAPRLGMDAIVGRALRTQTPVLAATMNEVIFRPYWNVPRSILLHEVLPAIARDPDYLRREDMEIVQGPGDDAAPVPPTADALAALDQGALRLRQRPGPRNALGLIKFAFPNREDVYMHGTPAQALFAKQRRDFSHGCVRVADPIALAAWVLEDRPEWTRERIVAATLGAETVHVALRRPVQVVLFYSTAAVMPDDGPITFADDIYRHDARLDQALARVHDERMRQPPGWPKADGE